VSRCRKRRARQLADLPGVHIPTLPAEHVQLFAEVEAVVQQYLSSSAYHFVPHSIFEYVKRANELAGIRVDSGGGKKSSRKATSTVSSTAMAQQPGESKRLRMLALPGTSDSGAGTAVTGAGMMGLQED
jgi:hypothetical protein